MNREDVERVAALLPVLHTEISSIIYKIIDIRDRAYGVVRASDLVIVVKSVDVDDSGSDFVVHFTSQYTPMIYPAPYKDTLPCRALWDTEQWLAEFEVREKEHIRKEVERRDKQQKADEDARDAKAYARLWKKFKGRAPQSEG